MNTFLELHDSDVQSVLTGTDGLRVLLSPAMIHRSAGRPGIDRGECGLQAVEILFRNPGVEKSGVCLGTIAGGEVLVDGVERHPSFSHDIVGDVRAQIIFSDASILKIRASSIRLREIGPYSFLQMYEGIYADSFGTAKHVC